MRMKNVIDIDLDDNLRCDCVANIDESKNSVEVELVHIGYKNPTVKIMLPGGTIKNSTDYEIGGSLRRNLHYKIPEEYWNTEGDLYVWVVDGSFTSEQIHFSCNQVGSGERAIVKANGTEYAISVYRSGNQSLIDMIYPVGSIIENANAGFNPNTVFSGTTWERIKGKVLVGVDEDDDDFKTSGKTGGEKTHKLTIAEMPSHQHSLTSVSEKSYLVPQGNYYGVRGQDIRNTDKTGGDGAHNNLQPYETVYIWKRTA